MQSSITANATHGFLLQIAYLLRAMKQNSQRAENTTLDKFVHSFLDIDVEYNSFTAKIYMDILLEILLKYVNGIHFAPVVHLSIEINPLSFLVSV